VENDRITPTTDTDPQRYYLRVYSSDRAVLHWTACPAVERYIATHGEEPPRLDDLPDRHTLLCGACRRAHPLSGVLMARHAQHEFNLKNPRRRPVMRSLGNPPAGAVTISFEIPTGQSRSGRQRRA